MRVAIIGLFNSGSSILSCILEQLGFEIGRPLWGTYFESRSLRAQLVDWWHEPELIEEVAREHRVPFLKWWVEHHESKNPLVCAKHPLLCLSAFDIEEAWGPNYKVIRAARPLEESIAGLAKRGWYRNPRRMQEILHAAAEKFFAQKRHHPVSYSNLLANPREQICALLDFLEIERTDAEIGGAAALIRPNKS
jgi:hypothetical protein